MKRFLAMLAALAAVVATAAPANATQNDEKQFPFRVTAYGHLVLDITLNGDTESRAILDTGATFPLIGRRTGEIFGFHGPEENGPTIEIMGLGTTGTYPVVSMNEVGLGDLAFDGLKAAYNSKFRMSGTDTVLPAALLPHRTLDFDFERSRLRAYDRRPDRIRDSKVSTLDIKRIHDLPFVEVRVNGKKGLALVDTGSSATMINAAFAQRAARKPDHLRVLELKSSAGDEDTRDIRILSSGRFVIGDYHVRRFNVIVVEPGFLAPFGLEDEPVMVLGLDILSQFRFQLDREADKVYISQPGKVNHTQPVVRNMPATRLKLD